MVQILDNGLTFDDVLLQPKHSTIPSRSNINLSVELSKPGFTTTLKHPIIPANMKTVIGKELAHAIAKNGGMGLLHRFESPKWQLETLSEVNSSCGFGKAARNYFGLSVGIKDVDKGTVQDFVKNGVKILCIDVAHGDSALCVDMTKWIAKTYPKIFLIAGNVATGEGAARLWEAGADAVKCGIGSGSICLTRINTGNGVPQLTALINVSEARNSLYKRDVARHTGRNYYIIADGGCKNPGDVVKSLCFADLVMLGNVFARCKEAPGTITKINGATYKEYVGSSTHKTNHVEGVVAKVPCNSTFSETLQKLTEGLRSGMSYQNAHNLQELKDNPTFIRMTSAGLRESHAHSVTVE